MIVLYINGSRREFGRDLTVAQLLEEMGARSESVAVELNLDILDRKQYSETHLNEGDRLEIISFVGGGQWP